MSSENGVTCIGNITRDPELKYAKSGTAFAQFGLAVNRRWQKDGEWQEAVSFIDVVVWGTAAENVAETFRKGHRAVVVGRFEQNTWETPDGDKRSKIELIADEVAPSLKWATAEITKKTKGDGHNPPNREEPYGSGKPAAASTGGDWDEEPF